MDDLNLAGISFWGYNILAGHRRSARRSRTHLCGLYGCGRCGGLDLDFEQLNFSDSEMAKCALRQSGPYAGGGGSDD